MGGTGPVGDAARLERIQRLVDECLRRRAAGESWPDEAVIGEHPDLMPELGERLRALRLVEEAARRADRPDEAAPGEAGALEGRCPFCRTRVHVKAEHAGRRMRCKCGRVFVADLSSSGDGTFASPPPPPELRSTIPGYEIERELGAGGMGRVYLARELSTKRQVALKVMLAGPRAGARQRRRFEREVEIAASLEHPNIARLYASGLHEGRLWFAMEYVEGQRLDEHVVQRRLGVRDILVLFASVCEGVNHAHQQGVMHRDLKPANILVDARGQPRILDFGLAKLTEGGVDVEATISMPGEIAGTPAYMSPEQVERGAIPLDIRSDVYSLGVILYELLTGQSPYGPRDTISDLLHAILRVEPQPPRNLRREIPDEVNSIVLKALEKHRVNRYQSAGDLGRDIAAHLAGRPVSAKTGSGWYMLRKTAVRYRGWVIAAAAVIVLSLGIGLLFAMLYSKTRIEHRPGGSEIRPLTGESIACVDARARGQNNGMGWADAYTELQDAIAAAKPDAEIWVVAGTYKPDRGTGDRTATFHLKSGVALYAGFAGGETRRHERDPARNKTILSGDLKGNDGPGFVNNSDNSLHVVTGSGTDATAVLDGFTITGGNAGIGSRRGSKPEHAGGGMYSDAGSPTVTNCTFRGNSANNDGGAMCNANGSGPQIARCVFERNRASNDGGAIRNAASSPVLVNCVFRGNMAAASHGGAVSNMMNASPTLANCLFLGNSASNHGGAVANMGSCSPILVGCTFRANSAKAFGGAVANVADSHPTLGNCILWGNTVGVGTDEAAQIQGIQNGNAVINHCCIQGWSGQPGGRNNLGADPQFVDPDGPDKLPGTADDNLTLKPGSPCIDKGDNAALPKDAADLDGDGDRDEPLPLDLAGGPRTAAVTVDIGAYESRAAAARVEDLIAAARDGDLDGVKQLLTAGGLEVNAKDRSGATALHVASAMGYRLMVDYLVHQHGADVTATDSRGFTPLHEAAWWNAETVTPLLRVKGAKDDVFTAAGLVDYYTQVDETILRNLPAQANARLGDQTPLHWAARSGRTAGIKLLTRHGADVNAQDGSGCTPLILAAREGHAAAVSLLLEGGARVDARTKWGSTALSIAAMEGRLEVVTLLLVRGADPNARDQRGGTPLYAAALRGHREIAKLLLDGGATMDIISAALLDRAEQIDQLLKTSPGLANQWQEGSFPLLWAAKKGNVAAAKALLAGGAKVDMATPGGKTPLLAAALEGHKAVTEVLIAAGAKPDLFVAAGLGDTDAMARLVDEGASVQALDGSGFGAMHYAAAAGQPRSVEMLLARGVDPDMRSKQGLTPLYLAASGGHLDVAKLLLDKGADPDARMPSGPTALVLVLASSVTGQKPQPEVAVELIRHGADVDVRAFGREGRARTPLHFAAAAGLTEVAKLLLDKGAAPGVSDMDAMSPLDLAEQAGHGDIAQMLRDALKAPRGPRTHQTSEPEILRTTGEGDTARPAKKTTILPAGAMPEKTISLDLGGGVTLPLTLVPAGKFVMGSPDSEQGRMPDEGPQHEATISKPFYMGVTEVTQAQYEAVMGTNPSRFTGPTNPVESVSWDDAVLFCRKLSEKTGKAFRLPTEAEWEYACRAGSKTRFSFGDSDSVLGDYAWYGSNSGGKTNPVGQKKPNAWGLYDMHGNVYEWCADWYGSYSSGASTDPQGAGSGGDRVVRGGSWDYDATANFRCAFRGYYGPPYRYGNYGFRCASTP